MGCLKAWRRVLPTTNGGKYHNPWRDALQKSFKTKPHLTDICSPENYFSALQSNVVYKSQH